jgi:hypothetical protein
MDITELDASGVRNQFPADSGTLIRLFQVDSEHCMIAYIESQAVDNEGTRSKGVALSACTCAEGFQSIPLSIARLKPSVCAHVAEVVVNLERCNNAGTSL